MTVLIGGSGSTGSSMLRTLLNRHSQIFSGPELNFFNKGELYRTWNSSKTKLLKENSRLFTEGWFPYPGDRLLENDYTWNRTELTQLINESKSIREFTEAYFAKPLQKTGASVWIEKTPSNAYCFQSFFEHFPEGRVVHMTRNPLDAIASLMSRGFSIFGATALWVYNSAAALSCKDDSRYFLLKYEELVSEPEKQVGNLLNFLELRLEKEVFNSQTSDSSTKISAWKNDPSAEISKKSMGRFEQLDPLQKLKILTALNMFELSARHIEALGTSFGNARQICKTLNYALPEEIDKAIAQDLRVENWKEFVRRSKAFYPTGWLNYPARLRA